MPTNRFIPAISLSVMQPMDVALSLRPVVCEGINVGYDETVPPLTLAENGGGTVCGRKKGDKCGFGGEKCPVAWVTGLS